MKYLIITFLLIYNTLNSTSDFEATSCKVLIKEISDSYKGDCIDGLADGNGEAKGIDVYKGKFKEGLPEGKGKYTYQNGNVFTGNFKKGLKHGEGKFDYSIAGKSYTQKGYWSNGDYVGLNNPEEDYIIGLQNGIDNFVIKKLNDKDNKVKISFFSKIIKQVPFGLKLESSSGQITQSGRDFIINHIGNSCFIEIEYTVTKGGVTKVCMSSFEILNNGSYEVSITND